MVQQASSSSRFNSDIEVHPPADTPDNHTVEPQHAQSPTPVVGPIVEPLNEDDHVIPESPLAQLPGSVTDNTDTHTVSFVPPQEQDNPNLEAPCLEVQKASRGSKRPRQSSSNAVPISPRTTRSTKKEVGTIRTTRSVTLANRSARTGASAGQSSRAVSLAGKKTHKAARPTKPLPTSSPPLKPIKTVHHASLHDPLAKLPNKCLINASRLTKKFVSADIPSWLHPYINTVTDVKADGHCGFRAIAVSLGQSEDDHQIVRKALLQELLTHTELYTDTILDSLLDSTYDECVRKLDTDLANVQDNSSHWLSMPGMSILIANAYGRAVCYYPTYSNQSGRTTYPSRIDINTKPPIVIAYLPSCQHFVSLNLHSLDSKDIPVPHLCKTWALPVSSSWLDRFPPESFELFSSLSGQKKVSRKGKERERLAA